MKQGTYEIAEYQIEVEGIIQNRKRIIYYTNSDELYLIEEYYDTQEEIRQGYLLKTI
jgi:hypothetical protein